MPNTAKEQLTKASTTTSLVLGIGDTIKENSVDLSPKQPDIQTDPPIRRSNRAKGEINTPTIPIRAGNTKQIYTCNESLTT